MAAYIHRFHTSYHYICNRSHIQNNDGVDPDISHIDPTSIQAHSGQFKIKQLELFRYIVNILNLLFETWY